MTMMRSVSRTRTRLLAPVGLLVAAGLGTALLHGHSGSAAGRPAMSLVADSARLSSPSASATPTTPATPSAGTPSAQAGPSAPDSPAAPASPSAPATPAAPAPAPPSAPAADADLRSAVAQADGAVSVSVSVTDLTTGQSLDYGAAGHTFATASIVKVDILATLLLQAQDKGSTLTAAQQGLATAMIENSDNDSATALWDDIGQGAGLDAADRRFGLTATTGGADEYWGLTATTAADQAQLLRQVFTGDSILSADSRSYLRTLLDQVESDQRWGVSAAATGGEYAVKDGWLPRSDTGLWVINSIGTVQRNGHELLIAVVSDGNASESDGISLVQSVARAAAGSLGS
ncbi:serine hydrolase [Kitasatospora sp. NPDC058965]|uniref:serine hydrolase n=1 Tax=Kitasatospora sp. NPDC058965 TaxID=3346682 RepID=UPI0036C58656